MVAQDFNLSYFGGISTQITVQGQPGQKYETLSEKEKEQKDWVCGSSGRALEALSSFLVPLKRNFLLFCCAYFLTVNKNINRLVLLVTFMMGNTEMAKGKMPVQWLNGRMVIFVFIYVF
jgi:hypothetical protein